MTDWQPIETAPKDGTTVVFLTDGVFIATGHSWLYTEPDIIGWDGRKYGQPNTERPNPLAGRTRWLWLLNGCTAFNMGADCQREDGEDGPRDFIPTHWMPPLAPPVPLTRPAGAEEVSGE